MSVPIGGFDTSHQDAFHDAFEAHKIDLKPVNFGPDDEAHAAARGEQNQESIPYKLRDNPDHVKRVNELQTAAMGLPPVHLAALLRYAARLDDPVYGYQSYRAGSCVAGDSCVCHRDEIDTSNETILALLSNAFTAYQNVLDHSTFIHYHEFKEEFDFFFTRTIMPLLNQCWAMVNIPGNREISIVALENYETGEPNYTLDFLNQTSFVKEVADFWNKLVYKLKGKVEPQTLKVRLFDEWRTAQKILNKPEASRRKIKLMFNPTLPVQTKSERRSMNVRVINQFRGFKFPADPDFIVPESFEANSLIMKHIMEVLACNNAEYYSWILDWFAYILQGQKLQSGLYFRGSKGSGKTTLRDIADRLFGEDEHHIKVDNPEATFKRQVELQTAVLVSIDEADRKSIDNVYRSIKLLATDETFRMLPMYKDKSIAVPNFANFMLLTDGEPAKELGSKERRWLYVEVNEVHGQKPAAERKLYFDALFKTEIDVPEKMNEFAQFLYQRKPTVDTRYPPITVWQERLMQQYLGTVSSAVRTKAKAFVKNIVIGEFWAHAVNQRLYWSPSPADAEEITHMYERTRLPRHEDSLSVFVTKQRVYNDYVEFVKAVNKETFEADPECPNADLLPIMHSNDVEMLLDPLRQAGLCAANKKLRATFPRGRAMAISTLSYNDTVQQLKTTRDQNFCNIICGCATCQLGPRTATAPVDIFEGLPELSPSVIATLMTDD